MADDKVDQLAERMSHAEGQLEAEDKSVDDRIDGLKHSQLLLIGMTGLFATASVGVGAALLVYILNRLDAIQALAHH